MQPDQIAAFARLFSAGVINELARSGQSPLFSRLSRQARVFEILSDECQVADAFELAFSMLQKRSQRNEYVYKSALTLNVLLGVHNLATASMLCEFRAGRSKADLVILNGTSCAYEIKSERDTLYRLVQQVQDYRQVFAKVYVLTDERHLSAVDKLLPADVGIQLLSARYQVSSYRSAIDDPYRTNPEAIFNSLRADEAARILKNQGCRIPDVPNTQRCSLLKEMFVGLSPAIAHEGMVKVLKKSRSLTPLQSLIDELPRSLHTIALATPIRKVDHSRLVQAVNSSLAAARMWA